MKRLQYLNVCRTSNGPGDPEETCDGLSSQCPEDEQGNDDDDDDFDDDRNGLGDDRGRDSGEWFDNNRTLVIALSAFIGGLLVLLIAVCIISSRVKRHKQARAWVQRINPVGTGPSNGGFVQGGQVLTAPPMVHRYA